MAPHSGCVEFTRQSVELNTEKYSNRIIGYSTLANSIQHMKTARTGMAPARAGAIPSYLSEIEQVHVQQYSNNYRWYVLFLVTYVQAYNIRLGQTLIRDVNNTDK